MALRDKQLVGVKKACSKIKITPATYYNNRKELQSWHPSELWLPPPPPDAPPDGPYDNDEIDLTSGLEKGTLRVVK